MMGHRDAILQHCVEIFNGVTCFSRDYNRLNALTLSLPVTR